jgi:hypothetical protein
MNAEAQHIPVPLDQPYRALQILRAAIQQKLDQAPSRLSAFPTLREGQRVVIVDRESGRAQFIARLISGAGYQPFMTDTTLTAYTCYLQGSFIPLVMILTENNSNDALVLLRLQQQVQQRYHWNIPFIRIETQETNTSSLAPAHLQSARPNSTPDAAPNGRTGPLPLSRPTNSLVDAPQDPRSTRTGPLQAPVPNPPKTPIPATTAQRQRLVPPAPISAVPTGPLPGAKVPGHFLVENTEAQSIIEIREIKKESLEGQNLGRFQIKERLGGSLLGDVYKAYDRLRETDIALKSIQRTVLPENFLSDAYVNTNFYQQEIDLLAEVKHPHIFPMMSAGKSYISGTPFYYKTMPLCQMGSLAAWRFGHGNARAYPWQEVLPIALQLGEALQFVHDHKLTYQNFKLTNVLLEGQAREHMSQLHVALADFMLRGDNKRPLHTPESLLYLAPEQWNGEALPASDQYGLAALLYELLTGRPPFPGNQERILRHMHFTMQPQSPRTFNPTITPMVDKLLLRALAKNPQDRFATISIFAHRLRDGE